VTFAFNGGPGFASAWLNLGAVGPWRIALGGDATAPSASPEPCECRDLANFTDLVFIDPAGTGFRALASSPDARRRLWSVGRHRISGEAIRRWLTGSTATSRRNTCSAQLVASRSRLARELAASQEPARPGDDIAGARPWRPQCRFEPFDM
jgi:hypothetical protein